MSPVRLIFRSPTILWARLVGLTEGNTVSTNHVGNLDDLLCLTLPNNLVSIKPGKTRVVFTSGALCKCFKSTLKHWNKDMTAALVAQYVAACAACNSPRIDAILTIWPLLRFMKPGKKAFRISRWLVKLTSRVLEILLEVFDFDAFKPTSWNLRLCFLSRILRQTRQHWGSQRQVYRAASLCTVSGLYNVKDWRTSLMTSLHTLWSCLLLEISHLSVWRAFWK